ncbi:MAG: glycosyltransferase family A protein [Parvularculaceae bacterium]
MIGFVAIGRNEGERFRRCLASLKKAGERIVYVDSGSADDSVAHARAHGALAVDLSMDEDFTAARARNAGFDALTKKWPDTEFVLFIDGDCELADGFTDAAAAELRSDETLGIVTGRCRERFPDATIYNRLCDMEWDGPVGEIDACGGIFMARASAFAAAGGFNPAVIAAEDDDFCIRVRESGAHIRRIGRDMCFHDADMHRFGQWWRRMVRAGHAFAQVGELHPGYFSAQRRRAWIWGLAIPAVALAGAPFTKGLSLALLLLYPLSLVRARGALMRKGADARHASLAAAFLTLSKFPNLQGMLDYRRKKMSGRKIAIVEYK